LHPFPVFKAQQNFTVPPKEYPQEVMPGKDWEDGILIEIGISISEKSTKQLQLVSMEENF
jgi:hypothetical protein